MAGNAQLALPLAPVPWLCAVTLRRPARARRVKPAVVQEPLFVERPPAEVVPLEPLRPVFAGRRHRLPLRQRRTPDWLAEPLDDEDRLELRVLRPETRGDCVDGPRPCPWVSCRHHLYLEVSSRGTLMFNHGAKFPWELQETCSLDVAEEARLTGEHTNRRVVGDLLGMVRERVRQIETGLKRHLYEELEGQDELEDDDGDA